MNRPLFSMVAGMVAAVSVMGAETPKAQLRATVDQVFAVLQDPQMTGAAMKAERHAKLRKILSERFDFEKMSQLALGRYWLKISEKQRSDFVPLFQRLLENTYMDSFDKYGSEKLTYGSDRQLSDTKVTVETAVVADGTEIPIDYNLYRKGDQWLIYDVKIEGVGLIKNYRTQFARAIRKDKFEGLVSQLKEKLERPDEG